MSKSINFFATKNDLESVLAAVEAVRPLRYTQAGMLDVEERPSLTDGWQIPRLGCAPSGTQTLEPFWLITDRAKKVKVEVVAQRKGGMRYGVDPGSNPEGVVLWPGGIFENSCLIAGRLGTGVLNAASNELLDLFGQKMRNIFKPIKSFLVGPEAE